MKYLLSSLIAIIILITALNVESKTPDYNEISGKVLLKNDTINQASFFNVYIDGTEYCTFTDEFGEFELSLPKGEYELIITSLTYGKIKKEIKVKKKKKVKYIVFI